MHPLQFNCGKFEQGTEDIPKLEERLQSQHVIPIQIFGTGLAAFHHQVPLDRWKIECLPVKSPWYPTYIGFGASYLTFFVWFWCWNCHFGVFGWWNSHAFDAEAIGFQSWAVLAICRNSKPTVPLLVWHTWELRPCFLSSKCQFGKTPFRWFIHQKATWNWLFWGIPYFLTNPFQIPNC